MQDEELDQFCINTIRLLAVDMVEKAKSGHPGLPMGAAVIAYVLWTKVMRHNPVNPDWPGRDRFILSAGHGSALLYSLLYLTGYDLPLKELMNFRQWGSKTPGHPEYGHTAGVETTTGPLGQGFANGVGMAIAERYLANHFNRPGHSIIDYFTYVICSDGDLMEGVSAEAASIAGHLRLGKLICLYDDNRISIEGPTDLAFTESVQKRFESYGWQVIEIDGNDIESVVSALLLAQKETGKPSLIKARTHIAYGSPNKQDTAAAHGEPLGEAEIRVTKERFGFSPDKSFYVPNEALAHFRKVAEHGKQAESEWQTKFEAYAKDYPELAEELKRAVSGHLPQNWVNSLPVFPAGELMATRAASGKILNSIVSKLPLLVGGSADLAPSTFTYLKGYCDFGPDSFGCPNFHFGVREHAMGAIINGMAISNMLIPYASAFLVFSDYMRPALRLASIMDVASIFVFTHDSIALGEDGPTHQPIEQLISLRAIPNLTVIRPADANETVAAWRIAIERRKPIAIILTRQKVPVLDPACFPVAGGVARGAYVLADSDGDPDLILIATGSEVHLALAARKRLSDRDIQARVVSMPSWELFYEQSRDYRDQVLPPDIKARLAIEAGASLGWSQWVGDAGDVIGIDRFGASAPGSVLLEHYGFTVPKIVARALLLIEKAEIQVL